MGSAKLVSLEWIVPATTPTMTRPSRISENGPIACVVTNLNVVVFACAVALAAQQATSLIPAWALPSTVLARAAS